MRPTHWYELEVYQTKSEKEPFTEWIGSLDTTVRAKARARIKRVQAGNLGDCKSVGDGVIELRIFGRPACRVYFAIIEQKLVLLLCAGDKSSQTSDIELAKRYLKDWKERPE